MALYEGGSKERSGSTQGKTLSTVIYISFSIILGAQKSPVAGHPRQSRFFFCDITCNTLRPLYSTILIFLRATESRERADVTMVDGRDAKYRSRH